MRLIRSPLCKNLIMNMVSVWKKSLLTSLSILSIGAAASLHAQKLTYEDHILPILETSCTNCHNPDKQKGGLDLTSYRGLITGGSGGKVATAGDGAGSKMFTTSAHLVEPLMPPEGERLGKKELNTIRAWIDGGLLETKNSVAKKDNTPKIDFSKLDTNKPSGPPPMPIGLATDPVVQLDRTGAISAIVASPWAPLIAITSEKQVLLYNTDNFDLEGVLPFTKDKGNPESLSFHPSGKYLLAGGGLQGKSGSTVTWDITNGKPIMTTAKEYDSVIASSLRSDLQAVTTSGPSRLIKMWQTADNSLQHNIKKHTDWVTNVSYSPDGILLATADRNGGLMVWEAESGNEFHSLRGHSANITALKWSTDSNFLASASEDGSFRIWDINSGREIKKVDAHKAGILSLDWAKSGEIITTGRDNKIKLWKPDYNLLKEITYPGDLANKACWSHDAKRFISSDYRGIITIWDSKSHRKIGSLPSNPANLTERIVRVQSQIAKQEQLATAKLSSYQASTISKQAHEAKILANINATKSAETTANNLKQTIKNEHNAIKAIHQKKKQTQQQLQQQQNKTRAITNTLKQTHLKLAQFDKQLTAHNAEVEKLNTLVQKLNTEIQQTQLQIQKEPKNNSLKDTLKRLQGTLKSDQKKLEQRKLQVVLTLKSKEDQHQLAIKQDAEHKQLRQQVDKLTAQQKNHAADVKKRNDSIRSHQQNVAKLAKTAQQRKQQLPILKKALEPIVEAENKAKSAYNTFISSITPIQAKLNRLQARKK